MLAAGLAWFLLFADVGQIRTLLHDVGAGPEATGNPLSRALLFAGAWTVMAVAMMLPSTAPLLRIFRKMTQSRPRGTRLVSLVVLGYLGVWLLFGLLAGVGVIAVRRGLSSLLTSPPGSAPTWIVPAALLGLAGAYQFSSLKDRCLDQCRTPFSFVAGHWHGESESRESFLLGWRHGIFCVGCCWALMLLMFAFGAEGVGWMLGLAALMGVEKNTRWGRSLVRPTGVLLLLASAWIVVQGTLGV